MSKRTCFSILGRWPVIILIVLGVLANSSCNGLRLYVSKTIPPDFTFDVGSFAECCTYFSAFAVLEEGSKTPLWRITSKKTVHRTEANSMVIHYGKVPNGFDQDIPTAQEPPQLVEGKTYLAVAEASYIPWANVRFMVKDNKIVSLPRSHR
jgi:hypothetical protein